MENAPVCWFLSPSDGRAGAGLRALRLAEAIAETGLAVRFIRPPADSDLPPIEQRVAELRAQWQADRPLCAHVEVPGYSGEPWRIVARELSIPLLSTWHPVFWMAPEDHQAAISVALRTFVGSCQQVLVETDRVRRDLAAQGIFDTTMVSNGVDTSRFDPVRRSGRRRLSWGAEATQPVVLYVGRLQPEKNLKLLLETFVAVKAAHPHARCIAVGAGSASEDLAKACPDLKILGHLVGDDLAEAYASADVFVFPSLEDMYGNVVLEAAASGLAVVAFDRAAAGDYLTGVARLIAPPDAGAFIAATVELVGDRHARQRLGASARTAVLPLTWANTAQQFLSAITRAQHVPPRRAVPGVIPVSAQIFAPLPADQTSEPLVTIRLLASRGHRLQWHHHEGESQMRLGRQTHDLDSLIRDLPKADARGAWSRRIEYAEGRLCAWAAGNIPVENLRIAACVQSPMTRTGTAARFHQMVAGLRTLGHAVQVQAESAETTSLTPSPDVTERQRRLSRLVAGFRHTWTVDRPDVVYIEVLDSFGSCAAEAAQSAGIPWVVTWHPLGAWIGEGERDQIEETLCHIAESAAGIVAEATSQVTDFARLGLTCAAITGNGVDLTRFHPDLRQDAMRATWNCQLAVLAVGRLQSAKNVAALIPIHDALAAVPGARLVIVGDGPERMALGAAMPQALFLGEISEAALPAIYASADLFVFPSRIDSYGLVVAEALASGLPVIGYDRAAIAELITNDDAGVRVPLTGDLTAAVINRCRLLLSDESLRATGRKAARSAGESCRWQDAAAKLAAVLSQVAAKK